MQWFCPFLGHVNKNSTFCSCMHVWDILSGNNWDQAFDLKNNETKIRSLELRISRNSLSSLALTKMEKCHWYNLKAGWQQSLEVSGLCLGAAFMWCTFFLFSCSHHYSPGKIRSTPAAEGIQNSGSPEEVFISLHRLTTLPHSLIHSVIRIALHASESCCFLCFSLKIVQGWFNLFQLLLGNDGNWRINENKHLSCLFAVSKNIMVFFGS